jgi:uncharacterized membrane protein YbhN (UPF0104 family)
MKSRTKKILQSVFSFALGAVILYFVFKSTGSDIRQNIDAFTSVNPIWLIITCLCYMLTNVSRTYRWQMLLEPLGYKPRWINTFCSIMVGYLANLGIPRSGEFIRGATLTKFEQVPFEQGMGTIVIDRILDFLSLFIIIFIGLGLHFNLLVSELSKLISFESLQGKLILGGGGVVGLAGIFILYKLLKRKNPSAFIQKILNLIDGFKEGLISIGKVKNIPLFLFHSFIIWFLYFLMTYLCIKGFGPTSSLTMSQALVVFIFGAFGMIIPTPGGMGSYQFALQKGLSLFGIAGKAGLALGNILFFTIQLFCNILFGVLAVILLPVLNRGKELQPNQA